MSKSRLAVVGAIAFVLCVHFFYLPKWKNSGIHAVITFDVFGYYIYLPAFFIFDDPKSCESQKQISKKYGATIIHDSAFPIGDGGDCVMKYPIGQAVQYSPFFAIAHLWASNSSKYEADGFSFPYQLLISLGSLLIAIIGLLYLRKILLEYFEEGATAITLLIIVFGTNYITYSAIGGAMTHNNLFTICTLIAYLTIRFYKAPNLAKALAIGGLIGLAALTRPTEIIMALIPIFWAVTPLNKNERGLRFGFFREHFPKILMAILVCLAIGSIQLFYWKWATGNWFVYSYQDQGFSWLHPHLKNGFFSYKAGWFTYSPVMVFSMIGFIALFKGWRKLFFGAFIYCLLHIYITFAWDIWWYGGSIGQRAMIQAYPILAFPIAAFMSRLSLRAAWLKASVALLIVLFTYLSLWFNHQAHHGGILQVSQMTNAYYWKTLGTYKKNRDYLKLLDTNQYFEGDRTNIKPLRVYKDFAKHVEINPLDTFAIDLENSSQLFFLDLSDKDDFEWLRINADYFNEKTEHNVWGMAQLIVTFRQGHNKVKHKLIRIQRLIDHGSTKRIYFDVKKIDKAFDNVSIGYWRPESKQSLKINNLSAETFSP